MPPTHRVGRTSQRDPTLNKHLGAIKRFFTGVLVAVLAGTVVTAVMAVKTAYYLSHFSC